MPAGFERMALVCQGALRTPGFGDCARHVGRASWRAHFPKFTSSVSVKYFYNSELYWRKIIEIIENIMMV